jgi:hypothetical protein
VTDNKLDIGNNILENMEKGKMINNSAFIVTMGMAAKKKSSKKKK